MRPQISPKPWLASSLRRLETGVFDVERLEKDGFVTDEERTENDAFRQTERGVYRGVEGREERLLVAEVA